MCLRLVEVSLSIAKDASEFSPTVELKKNETLAWRQCAQTETTFERYKPVTCMVSNYYESCVVPHFS